MGNVITSEYFMLKLKAATRTFDFVFILAAPVDKSIGVDLSIAHALAFEASQNRHSPYQ